MRIIWRRDTAAFSGFEEENEVKKGKKYKYRIKAVFEQGSEKLVGKAAVTESALAPAKAAVRKLSAGKKKLTVTYGRVSKATGYEIYISTKKSGGYKLAATVKKGKTTKAAIKKLKSKKTYYVKVRAYIKTKNGNIYGSFSKAEKVKVK